MHVDLATFIHTMQNRMYILFSNTYPKHKPKICLLKLQLSNTYIFLWDIQIQKISLTNLENLFTEESNNSSLVFVGSPQKIIH